MSERRWARLVGIVAVPVMMLGACGDDDDEASTDTTGAATTAAATTAAGATTAPAGTATSAAATTTSASGAENEASDTGVAPDSITVGLVWSASGSAAPLFTDLERAFKARVSEANDAGGVHGRTIEVETADDASTPQQNLTASQSLVETKDVFMVVNESAFTFGGFRYLVDQGIPTIGGGYDGTEWFEAGNELLVSIGGNSSPNYPQYTTAAEFMKAQGATRIASIGYGQSPSSSSQARKFNEFAVPAVGLEAVYTNTSLAFGTVDVGSVVLDMVNANADGANLPMINNTNFAIVAGARQAGLDLKVPLLATGYGQSLLDQPTAVDAGEGAYFTTAWAPVEIETEATQHFQEVLEQYADFTGVPGFEWYQGYISADLMIKGLEAAGQNPTRETFLEGLRGLGTHDGAGLACRPVDISAEGFGQPQPESCNWYLQLRDGAFVPVPESGEPTVGEFIEGSDA